MSQVGGNDWSPNPESIVRKAYVLSINAHRGQTNKFTGVPYYEHVLRVARNVEGLGVDEITAVAYLHDVVEDTAVTFVDLYTAGFTEEVVKAVDSVTRRENESYPEFILRAKQNPIGRIVKLADIADHLRQVEPRPGMHKKYVKGRQELIR